MIQSLQQHCLRAAYQAGYVWGQALKPYEDLPSPSEWGWKKGSDGTWYIHWNEEKNNS